MIRTRPMGLHPPLLRPFVALVAALSVGCTAGDDSMPDETSDTVAGDFVPPRDTDILLADLRWDSMTGPRIDALSNLTQRPGYDNQPYFVPDGSGLWYTVIDEHDGQADIWRYDFEPPMIARVTQSNPESEYSATPLPDGNGISTIRVEADSTQRLWRFDFDGSNEAVLLPGLAPVGYHAWADARTVVMFVLGEPATLQRGDVQSGRVEILERDVGRSIQTIPGTNDVSYVQRFGPERSAIMRLPGDGGAPVSLIDAVDGLEDHTWAPDGTLFMASGAVVHALSPGATEWTPIADFSELGISISRLAVSPDASRIAMVAEAAAPEGFSSN